MNYAFFRSEPQDIPEGTELLPYYPDGYDFEEDEETLDDFPIYYSTAIFCNDMDVSEFYGTVMVPLQDEKGDSWLMLGGGGMDFSWEICQAFYSRGYAPPLYACRLPAMSGRGTSDEDKELIAAVNEALKAEINNLEVMIKLNNNLRK